MRHNYEQDQEQLSRDGSDSLRHTICLKTIVGTETYRRDCERWFSTGNTSYSKHLNMNEFMRPGTSSSA